MGEIWLMRHAIYAGHRPGYHAPDDAPLTDTGRSQTLSAPPLPERIDRIVTSPLRRARETASLLSATTGVPLIAESGLLREWSAPSSVLGHTSESRPRSYERWRHERLHDPDKAYEDGESLRHLHERAQAAHAFLQHMNRKSVGDLLVVTHKVLGEVLTHLEQGPAAFETASVSTWEFTELRRCR